MKKLNYYVLDVFTDQKYKGNPLSVVWCDEELETQQYYDIAREFGYSETSFVHYSSTDKAFKVRSFTPGNFEVTGAGHNLLGAVCLALLKDHDIFREQQGEQWVMMKDEKIPLVITEEAGLPFVAMQQQTATILKTIPSQVIADALGLTRDDLALFNWKPTIVKTEVAHVMVPVKDSDALNRAVSNKSLLEQISEQYGFEGYYLYTTNHQYADYITEARFFNPYMGIDEDAATGTAAGPLAGYLSHVNYINRTQNYRILQGVQLNQPSSILVKVMPKGILVSGSAVITMEGVLYL